MNQPERIRLAAFDIDGVFTDGRFLLSDEGVESKAFSTQDGFGLRRALDSGIEIAIISGRASKAVEIRMSELGVRHVFLACKDKTAIFRNLIDKLDLSAEVCAYVGDDIPDLELMKQVGLPIAVANAVDEVKQVAKMVTTASGGDGAVREVCDFLVRGRASA